MNDIVADLVGKLPEELKEEWEERAAIMEFDGGLSRSEAEALALLCVIRDNPAALLPSYMKEKSNE